MIRLIKADEPCKYIADKLEDVENLPTDPNYSKAGSECTVIEDSSVWTLGNDYQWHQTIWYR